MKLPFKIGISPKLKIRGIIASEDIKPHTVIEKCPVILVDIKQEEYLEKTSLRYYYFEYSNKYHAVVLGYLSLVNHSFTPNCELIYDYKNRRIGLKSIMSIKKGEELTYEYMDQKEAKLYPELFDFNKGIK